MYKNRLPNGKNNLCGERIKYYRRAMAGSPSQRAFADMLQIAGLDVDKNAVQRIECGKRFVTDIELAAISRIIGVSCDELLGEYMAE